MTGREKIMIVVAGAAVGWGLVAFLGGSAGTADGSGVAGSGGSGVAVVRAQAFRMASESALAVAAPVDTERRVLDVGRADWDGSYFGRGGERMERGDEPVVETSRTATWIHRFTGYGVVGGVPFAIIDGRVYQEGDLLKDQDLEVLRIHPDALQVRWVFDGSTKEIAFEGKQHEEK